MRFAPTPETNTTGSIATRPTPRLGLRRLALPLILAISAIAFELHAQESNTPTNEGASAQTIGGSTLPSVSQIEAKIAEVGANAALDEAGQAALTESYRRAIANLESARTSETKANTFSATLTTAPAETAAIAQRLEEREPIEAIVAAIPSDLTSEEITQRLSIIVADAAIEETRVRELENLIERNTARPAAIRARLSEVRSALDQVDVELGQTRGDGSTPELAEARTWALETRRHALLAEARMLEQELLSQSVRETLHRAQREEATVRWEALRAQQRQLEELQNQRRRAKAEAAQRESERAEREAADKHVLIQTATSENSAITASLTRLAEKLEGFDTETDAIEAERKRIEEDFKASQQRIEAAGLSRTLGQVLVERRDELPDLRQHRRAIELHEDAIAESTLRQIRYREEQRRLRDIERYVDELIAADPSARIPGLREELTAALEQRRRLIEQVLVVEDDYARQLGELNDAADQLIQTTQRYDAYLAERLLWVRSALPIGVETFTTLPSVVAWLIDPLQWLGVLQVLAQEARQSPLLWGGSLLIAILFWKLSGLRRAIRATAEPLRRIRTDRLSHTAKAIGLTLLAALPVSLLMLLLGQILASSDAATAFTRALGSGLTTIALGLYYIRAFRTLCIPGGVGDRHFRWSQSILKTLRRELDWFSFTVVPVALIALVIYNDNDPAFGGSLGRLALIATMLGFAVVFARVLSPRRGVLHDFLETHPDGWLNRMRWLWYPAIVGTPLVLALLAMLGYVYTAGVLFESMVQQTWLALALVVIHQLIVRWLMIARRRLALQAAIDRSNARRAQAEAERNETSAPTPSLPLQVEEPEPDLAALDGQTRRLINISILFAALLGVWLTWSNVLPALSILERITLWHHTGMVDGVEQMIPVTAGNLGLVFVIAFVATVAARNLPALIEILLLQTESVSAGGRYAIKTLASYSITVVAFLLAFSTLGLNWGQVQWLVAALGVGIGFGLQEIVANFISGIIILFERPVRVGDIVTIGDTTGVVTNIQIRATTIRNWDKQELLVPNKEFITGRLLNWSLTDQQNRITILVSIEYGSDTRRALAILAEIAASHERVLKDPAPLISFEGFGENALLLALRCYMESLDGRIGVITELNQAIYDRFSAEGIGLAFPQRDVHLSQRQPLDVRLRTVGTGSTDTGVGGGAMPRDGADGGD